MRKTLNLILMTLLTASFSHASEIVDKDCDCSAEPFAELKKLSDSLPEIIGLAQVSNIPEFCRVDGLRDKGSPNMGSNPWTNFMVASADFREKFFFREFPANIIDKVRNAQPPKIEQLKTCDKQIEDRAKKFPIQENAADEASFGKSAFICKDVTILHVVNCAKSIHTIIELVQPRDDINLVDVWRDIFKDPIYLKVMKKVALQNFSLLTENRVPKTRYFDDLKQAFNDELHDSKKATDYTFNVLGVLASNGNNSHDFMPCEMPVGFSDTIKLLNLGSGVLDRKTAKNGFLYTYPKEVDSLCDYGKNYHFWMSAFLSRELAKKTGDIKGSAAAAYSVDKMYQFMKNGAGRDPTAAFREDTFSNYNNNMRLDLTQSAAGAWFGALSQQSKPKILSREKFENGMRKIFGGSQKLPSDPNFKFPVQTWPESEFDDLVKINRTYVKWKKIINPDAGYLYFENELNP